MKLAQTRGLPGVTRGRAHVVVRIVGWLLLVYAVVWTYHFAIAFLGPFGPLAFLLFVELVMLADPRQPTPSRWQQQRAAHLALTQDREIIVLAGAPPIIDRRHQVSSPRR